MSTDEGRPAAEGATPQAQPADTDTWLGSPAFHLHVAETLDERSRAVWDAATSQVLDLLARREITMDAGIPSDQPDHLEILLTEHEDVAALGRILSSLDRARYGNWTLHAAVGGPPFGAVIARVDRNQVPSGGVVLIRVDRTKLSE